MDFKETGALNKEVEEGSVEGRSTYLFLMSSGYNYGPG